MDLKPAVIPIELRTPLMGCGQRLRVSDLFHHNLSWLIEHGFTSYDIESQISQAAHHDRSAPVVL